MGFTAKDSGGSGGEWEPVPRGVYQAVCYAVVDLGTQFNQMYGHEQHQCWISWELPTEEIEIEGEMKPRVISRFYTVSLGEKAHLRNHLESWRGQSFTDEELAGFDISRLIGVNCQLNIIHKTKKDGKIRAEVSSIMPLSKGMKKVDSEAEYVYFSIEEHGLDIPDTVPEGIKRIFMKSREWNESNQQMDSTDWRTDNAPPPLQDSDPWADNQPPQEPPGGLMRQPEDESDIPF